jgi:Asp-tRNA(Asn)/Glu-tRNA(Gln) amidotransferase A subunit family amidase
MSTRPELLEARRRFLAACSAAGVSASIFPAVLLASAEQAPAGRVTETMVREAAALAGLALSDADVKGMLTSFARITPRIDELHRAPPENDASSPLQFSPRVAGFPVTPPSSLFRPSVARSGLTRPAQLDDVLFWPLVDLASLVRRRLVTAVELAELSLSRLERFNPRLNCVVTLLRDRAIAEARERDRELAAGRYRGLLHGLPWGAKDIISARGGPTTWGTGAFRDRVIDRDATVVTRLATAGAVLTAKLTTGEMAFGDQWFGGRTNNPWNPEQGSSGSSAGSGVAPVAGLVAFAIGTDTGGSILSPAVRCGGVGLRPTFGRVSRHGVMAAGWTLDKVGPMCRRVEDCAIVLQVIAGPDDQDLSVPSDMPCGWDTRATAKGMRVGVVPGLLEAERDPEVRANSQKALEALREAGVSISEVSVPQSDLTYFIEYIERAAGFETFWRNGLDTSMRIANIPRDLRAYHLVPAVDYLQANRERYRLMEAYARATREVDVMVAGSVTLQGATSLNPITSLTGHPAVAVPTGFRTNGTPTGLTFAGRLYDEARLLVLARVVEQALGVVGRRPPGV